MDGFFKTTIEVIKLPENKAVLKCIIEIGEHTFIAQEVGTETYIKNNKTEIIIELSHIIENMILKHKENL